MNYGAMQFLDYVNRETLMIGTFLIFILMVTWYLIREQRRNPSLALTDLVTGDNGKYSSPKFFQAGAFFATTWAFLWFCVTGKADETLLLGYAALWAGAAAANKVIGKGTESSSPTSVTVTSTGDKSVEVKTG